MGEPVGVIREGENLAFVRKAVEERGSKDWIAQEVSPAIEALVGGNDDGGILVELGDELEEEVGFHSGNRKITEFVNNEQVGLFDPLDTGL